MPGYPWATGEQLFAADLNAAIALSAPPVGTNYLPTSGAMPMTGPLTLAGNATQPLHAVPLQQMNATIASYAPLASPTFTGAPSLPTGAIGITQTVGNSTTALATTAFVQAALPTPATVAPLMNAAAAVVGTSLLYSRQDHVHPTDTSRAPLASPTFTGTVTAPTVTGAQSAALSGSSTLQPIRFDATLTGSTTADMHPYQFDTYSNYVNNGPNGHYTLSSYNIVGAGGGGKGQTALLAQTNVNGTGISNLQFAVGAEADGWASVNVGGTSGTPAGQLFGFYATSLLQSGGTYWSTVQGQEINVGINTGASAGSVCGLSVVNFGQVAGSQGVDTGIALGVGPQTPIAGWNYGIRFGLAGFGSCMASNGTLIWVGGATGAGNVMPVGTGIDFSKATFSNALLKTPASWTCHDPADGILFGIAAFAAVGSNVNYMQLASNSTGNSPSISALGTDANIGINFQAVGTGSFLFYNGAATTFQVAGLAGQDGWPVFLPGISASRASQLFMNGAGNNFVLGGTLGGGGIAANTTTGLPMMPLFVAAPTGTPVNNTAGAAFALNFATKVLNIHVSGSGWYHVALTAGAG